MSAVVCNRIWLTRLKREGHSFRFALGLENEAVLINKQENMLPGAAETLASNNQLQEEIPATPNHCSNMKLISWKPQLLKAWTWTG